MTPFGLPYLSLGILKLLNDALNFAGPLLLNALLGYLDSTDDGAEDAGNGDNDARIHPSSSSSFSLYTYASNFDATLHIVHTTTHTTTNKNYFGALCALLLAATFVLKAFLNAHFTYQQGLISARARAALTSLCFRQTLSLSASTLASSPAIGGAGRVQTLMAVDTDKVLGIFQGAHELWSLPLQILVALYLLYIQVKSAFVAGLALVLLLIPFNRLLARGIQVASVAMMDAKDRRIAVIGEMLRGIRVVKAAGWEPAFVQKIDAVRRTELRALAVRKYLDAVCVYLWAATSLLFSLGTFGLYVWWGEALTAQIVFTALALFSVLLGPINSFPWVINGIVEAGVSLRRLSSFLHPDNTAPIVYPPPPPPPLPPSTVPVISTPLALSICGSFSWGGENTPSTPVLRDIGLSIPRGRIVVVEGGVAAGKTSLLLALLGELKPCHTEDYVHRDESVKRIAYVGQDPWLMQGTIAQNILLNPTAAVGAGEGAAGTAAPPPPSSIIDIERYEQVLYACALHEDLEKMPRGDGTQVGGGGDGSGSTLSGGQRTRVALARALYADPDVYILDDILASVDARVGAWIVRHVLKGPFVQGKTVVLTTHDPSVHAFADVIVTLNKGRITWQRFQVQERHGDGLVPPSSAVQRVWRRGWDVASNSTSYYYSKLYAAYSRTAAKGGPEEDHENGDDDDNGGEGDDDKATSFQNNNGNNNNKEEEDENDGEEARAIGHVQWAVYRLYCTFQGVWAPLTLLSLTLMQATRNGSDVWLSYWVSNQAPPSPSPSPPASPFSPLPTPTPTHVFTPLDPDVAFYLKVLFSLAALNSVFTLLRAFSFAQGGLVAARRLHTRLLASVLSLPPTFFDSTPSGRILNRFSSDISIADDSLPFIANIFLAQAFGLAGVGVVLCFTQPYLLIALAPIIVAYRFLQRYYRCTSREVRRLESIAKSPIYSTFSSVLSGGVCIRAFDAQPVILATLHDAIASQQRASLASLAVSTWLGLRLQVIAAVLASLISGLAVAQHARLIPGAAQSVSAGFVGLSLAYALPITGLLNGLLTAGAETEQEMVAVERIAEYIDAEPQQEVLPPVHSLQSIVVSSTPKQQQQHQAERHQTEPSPELPQTPRPTGLAALLENGEAGGGSLLTDAHWRTPTVPGGAPSPPPSLHLVWPSQGSISYRNVWLKYTPTSEYVLQSLSFDIPPGSRAGIVGRTGAGKSSTIACLLRLAEICGGEILIDGVDVRRVPLRRLRTALGYVPQTPFVFSGSVAENLDPRSVHGIASSSRSLSYTKREMIDALKKVKRLWDALYESGGGGEEGEDTEEGREEEVLEIKIGGGEEGSVNLSQGLMQMLCLARVVLQNPKIVLLDEALASVDPVTAEEMQHVVGACFSSQGCTVVEIAHRLRCVAACDVVFVMEGGRVAERGGPEELARTPGSIFGDMLRKQEKTGVNALHSCRAM